MLDVVGGAELRAIALVEISGERRELARLAVAPGGPARAEPMVAPFALAPNGLPMPERRDALEVPLVMTGGAKNETDMSFMMGKGPIWQFNGHGGMATESHGASHGEPLARIARGRTMLIRYENKTSWPHAMHLHGHHFRLLERQGGRPPEPYWWDTLLVQPGETALTAFVADNPGNWMIHCHMLDHQASGMDTWFEVT